MRKTIFVSNISKIHTKFKQHPINNQYKQKYTAHPHDGVHVQFIENTAMRF